MISQTPDPAETEHFDVYGVFGPSPPNNYVACDSSGPVAPGTYARTVRSTAAGIGVNGASHIIALKSSGSTTTSPSTTTTSPSTTTTTPGPGGSGPAVLAAASVGTPSAASSLALPVPAGVQSGQYLLAAVAVTNGAEAITAPPGWTLVGDAASGGSGGAHLVTFAHWATSSEPSSYRFGWTTLTSASGGILAIAGVSATTPLDVAPKGSPIAVVPSSWTAPSITTAGANDLLVTCWTTQGGYSQTPDPAETEHFDVYGVFGPSPPNNYVACDSSGPVAPGTYARTVRSTAAGIGVNGASHIIALKSSATGMASPM